MLACSKGLIMQNLRKLMTLTLLFALMASSIQGQENYYDDQDENVSSAYQESVHAAHWSIYIPIAIYVVAAVYLGIADTHHSKEFSHSRSDALGPAGTSSSGSNGSFSH
jgi:hypothetical protein